MSYFRIAETRNMLGQRRWRWNLHAGNGEIVATSEAYNTREAAEHGAEVVKREAASAPLRWKT
jgi:uncharacterized protein YegP (UPF0339 family)